MHAREAELRLWTRPARSVPASEHRRGRGPQFPHLYKGRRAPTSLKELPYVTGFECSPLPPPPVHRHLTVDALSGVNWQLFLSLCSVVVPPKIDGIIDQIRYYKKHTALNAGRDLGCSRCYQQGCPSRKETGWHLLSVLGHLIVRTDGQRFSSHVTAEHGEAWDIQAAHLPLQSEEGADPGGCRPRPRPPAACFVWPVSCEWFFLFSAGCQTSNEVEYLVMLKTARNLSVLGLGPAHTMMCLLVALHRGASVWWSQQKPRGPLHLKHLLFGFLREKLLTPGLVLGPLAGVRWRRESCLFLSSTPGSHSVSGDYVEFLSSVPRVQSSSSVVQVTRAPVNSEIKCPSAQGGEASYRDFPGRFSK